MQLYVSPRPGAIVELQEKGHSDREYFAYMADKDSTYWFTVATVNLRASSSPPTCPRSRRCRRSSWTPTRPEVHVNSADRHGADVQVAWHIQEEHPEPLPPAGRVPHVGHAGEPVDPGGRGAGRAGAGDAPPNGQRRGASAPANDRTWRETRERRSSRSPAGRRPAPSPPRSAPWVRRQACRAGSPTGAAEGPGGGPGSGGTGVRQSAHPSPAGSATAPAPAGHAGQTPAPLVPVGPMGPSAPTTPPVTPPGPPPVGVPGSAPPAAMPSMGSPLGGVTRGSLPPLQVVNKRQVKLDFEVGKFGPSGAGIDRCLRHHGRGRRLGAGAGQSGCRGFSRFPTGGGRRRSGCRSR